VIISYIGAYADHTVHAGHFTALDDQHRFLGNGDESEKGVTGGKVSNLLKCSSAGKLALNQPSLSSLTFYLYLT
jgi:hypothetical protein